MRVLWAIRQSKKKELSESPATQRGAIGGWTDLYGHSKVDEAVDVGVSAEISPFKRPSLGPWLTDPELLAEWDIIAFWKIDRAVRSMKHFYGELVPELERLGKKAVAVTEGVDTATSSAMELSMRVAMAQEELKLLKDRSTNSRARLRENARWHGGIPYFGYYSVKTPDGYKLAIDEDALDALDMVLDLLDRGYTINYATSMLTQEGVLSARDRHNLRMGRPSLNRPWRRQTLVTLLKSRHLLGQMTSRNQATGKIEVIRDEKGKPRQFGEPLMDRERWDKLQELVRKPPRSYRRKSSSMLLRVAYCEICGRPMYVHPESDRDIRRYYCSSVSLPGLKDCDNRSFPAETLESLAEELFLGKYGDVEVIEKQATPIVDYKSKIGEVDEMIENLTGNLSMLKPGSLSANRVVEQINAYEAEREEMVGLSAERQGVNYVHTGQTYRDLWEGAEAEDRGDLLRQYGISIMARTRTAEERDAGRSKHRVVLNFPQSHERTVYEFTK